MGLWIIDKVKNKEGCIYVCIYDFGEFWLVWVDDVVWL